MTGPLCLLDIRYIRISGDNNAYDFNVEWFGRLPADLFGSAYLMKPEGVRG